MKRILIAEDDSGTQDLYKRFFGAVYELNIVSSAKSALEALTSENYDLLITDNDFGNCGIMTGDQLIEQTLRINPSQLILMVSSYKPENKEIPYFKKPVIFRNVKSQVQEMIGI